MKRSVFGFLAILLSAQYSWAADVDVTNIATAKDSPGAITAYLTYAQARISAATTAGVSSTDTDLATKHITKIESDAKAGTFPSESEIAQHRENESDTDSNGGHNTGTDTPNTTTDTNAEDEAAKKAAQKAKIAELQQNYDDAKANEQSLENKLLGATGMATMGIGGMQLAQGLSEKSADEAAEMDMQAYLNTFTCRWGDGKSVRGGEVGIELTGGNELFSLVNEYKALAADLKLRKEALGMMPGIESEEILDKATSGLYDDVSLGKGDGVYTSLSKALSDENSEDAAEWNAQKAESQKKVKTGAGLAIGGAVGTAVLNLMFNADKPDENSDEILRKYKTDVSRHTNDLQSQIDKLSANTSCPTNANGTAPNCNCTTSGNVANMNSHVCAAPQTQQSCATNEVYISGSCTCPEGAFFKNEENKCTYLYSGYNTSTALGIVTIPTDKIFTPGTYNLTNDAQKIFRDWGKDIKSQMEKITKGDDADYCIIVQVGTDRVGDASTNETLSGNRARVISDAMNTGKMAAMATGEALCTSGDESTPSESCRRATITIAPLSCEINSKTMNDPEFRKKFGVTTGSTGLGEDGNFDLSSFLSSDAGQQLKSKMGSNFDMSQLKNMDASQIQNLLNG